MDTAEYRPSKIFTVDEANRTLPLVRAIVKDLTELAAELGERKNRIERLQAGRDDQSSDIYGDEVAEVARQLEKDAAQLEGYVNELRSLGVEVKSVADGIVDFPCVINDELVLLCWRINEPNVSFWHRLEDGFAGRQPIPNEYSANVIENSSC